MNPSCTQTLLVIGYVWPEPNSSAAGSRMMQLLDFFATQGWSITFASAAQRSSHMADIESLGVRIAEIELNNSSFDAFVKALNPDTVIFDRFMIEEQFGWRVSEQCPNALRILDTEDLHCLRDARHRALKEGCTVSSKHLNSELAIREVAAILRCDTSLMISQYEINLLTQHYHVPANLLFKLPFMLEPVQAEGLRGFEPRHGYISIGNFRHAPNWDAVLYLKQTIWPLIRKLQPQAELFVYGAYPPPKATQLDNPKQGFHVKGWADDVERVMKDARVCLAPLRFGAGLKGKLSDAMSCGTPSVTTSTGAEAMHGELPWGGAVCDEPEAFASAAVQLHDDAELWHQAQDKGASIINTLFDHARHKQRLMTHLTHLRSTLPQHRLDNFFGSMLQHHTLQSTRYMAQWIEAKNRLPE